MASLKNPYGKISTEYAVGRIRALEGTLLSSSDFVAINTADSVQTALRILTDKGYGNLDSDNNDDITLETLIENELYKTSKTISELSPDLELTDLFLLDIDAHNMKVYLKSKLTNEDVSSLIIKGGTINPDIIRVSVETDDYSMLSDTFVANMSGIDNLSSPRLISTMVDKAMYKYIFDVLSHNKNKILFEYFSSRAKFIDINTVLRGKVLSYDEKDINSMLITTDNLVSLNVDDSTSVVESEKEMNVSLLKILRNEKSNSFSIAPVICYLLDKRNEALNLRIIFAAKISGNNINLKELNL